jgi:hypothetical protein
VSTLEKQPLVVPRCVGGGEKVFEMRPIVITEGELLGQFVFATAPSAS